MHVLFFDHLCCNAIILLLYCLNSQAVKQKTNLLYSLPTSSGKTMVAEIVMLQVAFLSQKLTTVVMMKFRNVIAGDAEISKCDCRS